jgi:hypothetical protein
MLFILSHLSEARMERHNRQDRRSSISSTLMYWPSVIVTAWICKPSPARSLTSGILPWGKNEDPPIGLFIFLNQSSNYPVVAGLHSGRLIIDTPNDIGESLLQTS